MVDGLTKEKRPKRVRPGTQILYWQEYRTMTNNQCSQKHTIEGRGEELKEKRGGGAPQKGVDDLGDGESKLRVQETSEHARTFSGTPRVSPISFDFTALCGANACLSTFPPEDGASTILASNVDHKPTLKCLSWSVPVQPTACPSCLPFRLVLLKVFQPAQRASNSADLPVFTPPKNHIQQSYTPPDRKWMTKVISTARPT